MMQMPCVLLMPRTFLLFFIAGGVRKGQQIVFRSDLLCTMKTKRTHVAEEREREGEGRGRGEGLGLDCLYQFYL